MDWEFDKTNKENAMQNLEMKTSPISQELTDLSEATATTEQLISQLVMRLEPALSPNVGKADSGPAAAPQRSALADGIRDQVDRVAVSNERLTEIIRRLEL